MQIYVYDLALQKRSKRTVNPVAISEEKSDNEDNMIDGSKVWKWKYE